MTKVVVIEEPFRREHVSLDLNNEEGPSHGKSGGTMRGIHGSPGISLVSSRNRKKDTMTAGLQVKQDVGDGILEVSGD